MLNEGLDDRIGAILDERGPQTKKELLAEGITKHELRISKNPRATLSAYRARMGVWKLSKVFPTLARQAVYYKRSQEAELGLRIGAELLTQQQTAGQKVLIAHVLKELAAETAAITKVHYISTATLHKYNGVFFRQLVDARYITREGCHWELTPLGEYSKLRVQANILQNNNRIKINKQKPRILAAETYEGLTALLGWPEGFAERYAAAAQASGRPLRVYVIGTDWQRLFNYGIQRAG